MLYELLVGSLPFAGTELRGVGLLEVQRVMRDVEPPRPSRRLGALAAGEQRDVCERRASPASSLVRALRTDLDWIVLCAMAKDRTRRYESASAADLHRYLAHEPLVAGPPSAGYRLRKFVRRYRSQVVAVTAVLLTALAGAGVAIWFAVVALDLAEEKSELATAEAAASAAATTNATLFENKLRDFDLLSGVVLHARCLECIPEFQPPWPVRESLMQQWLDEDVHTLVAMLPEIEATLARLQALAPPRSEEQFESVRRQHARFRALRRRSVGASGFWAP